MADNVLGRVVAIWPQDRRILENYNQMLPPDLPRWVPSIEHSPTTCDECGIDCWIGPKQLELLQSPFFQANKLCVGCIMHLENNLRVTGKVISVNIDNDQVPRRWS